MDDVCAIAIALAQTHDYAVFPCNEFKRPRTPQGFKDASKDPATIRDTWEKWPGPLIGVATGATSSISVLDIDVEHDTARAWWRQHCGILPETRIYRTRSGGLHLLFRHKDGVSNTQGKLAVGVDTRGDGGYIIFWFAAGFPCELDAPPAAWPSWLYRTLWPPAQLAPIRSTTLPENSINGLVRTVREAREGTRNGKLNWAAFKMREHIARGAITQSEAHQELLAAAMASGLPTKEAIMTLTSAFGS